MKKKSLTGRLVVNDDPVMQNLPGTLADRLDKVGLPSLPRYHYAVRSSHDNLYPEKGAPRIYFADTYHDAVNFVGSLKTWGNISPHNGGIEWRIEV